MPPKRSTRPISLIIKREFNNNNNDLKIEVSKSEKNRTIKYSLVNLHQNQNKIENKQKRSINTKEKTNNLDIETSDYIGYKESSNLDTKIDKNKVNKTFKMIEKILNENDVKKKNSTSYVELKHELEIEEEKHKYLRKKNIRVNLSTNDSQHIIKKPIKINVTNEIDNQFEENQFLFAKNGRSYLNFLVHDVGVIFHSSKKNNENKINYHSIDKNIGQYNSLGLAMEGTKGINLAILKGKNEETDQLINLNNQILYKANFQDLESLILSFKEENNEANFLKIAKLNRFKVLLELSLKMVGRKYKEISNEERIILETEANRFQTIYPMPGDRSDKENNRTLKIVNHNDSNAKIEINSKLLIDPIEFLSIYTNQIVTNAQNKTGLEFDNITVTIPAAYGTKQREAIKNSVNEATERTDVQILTRPVAAAVILTNQRNDLNHENSLFGINKTSYNSSDSYKLVFDITASSLDASVIRILNSKEFQVISNVGDSSFGSDDVNQRILEYILKKKFSSDKNYKSAKNNKEENNPTIHEYINLIESIKKIVVLNDMVRIDLSSLKKNANYVKNSNEYFSTKFSNPDKDNELTISKKMISQTLCKDIYDWFIIHIEKAIIQAYLNNNNLDEIIIIGSKCKIPGFYELLKEIFLKKISFVDDEDLAIGAAIVGKKSKFKQIKVTEVLCKSVGIGLYTGVISYLLFRNSSLPCIGGCIYSTLIDDQETMVLDVYEGERPHIKFCRYLGEVKILNLPKGKAGSVKCELFLKMNHEGLLEVNARDLKTGLHLETIVNANPYQLDNDVNNDTELDPVEAERYKKEDYNLVYELESLDDYLDELSEKFTIHQYSKIIIDKIVETKEWLFKNRRNISDLECKKIRQAIENFLKDLKNKKITTYK